jgi:hypothetical protein
VELFVLSVSVVAKLAGLFAAHVADFQQAIIYEHRRQ